MRLPLLLLLLPILPLLTSCNPAREQVSIGPPATRALKTEELAQDAHFRLNTLASQLPLASNAVFTSYQPRGPVKWSSGWARRINLTGVSWSQKQAGTAITPRHIVLAAHYALGKGKQVTFHDRSGKPHTRTITQLVSLRNRKDEARSDIAVALLDRALPPEVKTYRLLPPRTDYPQTLTGCPALVTEQQRRVYIHQVRSLFGRSISFQKSKDYPEEVFKSLIVGDSGNPSFLLVGGEPVLIETHTGGGGGSGPFYSAPEIFAALQETVAALDPSYRIQTVPLDPKLAPAPPEPPAPAVTPTAATAPYRGTPAGPPAPTNPTPPPQRAPRVRRVPVTE